MVNGNRLTTGLLAACASALLPLIAASMIRAQNPTGGGLVSSFVDQLGRLGFKPLEGSQVVVLRDPLPVPSHASAGAPGSDALRVLWAPPILQGPAVVKFAEAGVEGLLADYFADTARFQLGDIKLDTDASKRLDQALRVIFVDPRDRTKTTQEYQRYTKWTSAREELVKKIEASNSEAEKKSLARRLGELDEDYNLTGERSKIETARDIVGRSTSDKDLFISQLNALRTLLKQNPEEEALGGFYGRLASRAGWTRVTTSAGQDGFPKAVRVTLAIGDNQQTQIDLDTVDISYQSLLVALDRPVTRAALLGNRAWRRRDSAVISDGQPGVGKGELVPAYVTHVLVAREVDVAFDTRTAAYKRFGEVFPKARGGRLDALPFNTLGPASAYCLPGHMYLPQPRVVGVVVASPPMSPNPEPELVWE